MAVKAKASITVSHIIDISSVTRYYILQSSTLTAPSKPTTNPPSDNWSTVEPSYTDGSTNTLYFVDCTVFTNDAFTYSNVSKSSSYEAAKAAYNKANSVESSVNDLVTRVTDAETQISANTSEIVLRATKTEVTEAIDSNSADIVNNFEKEIDSSNEFILESVNNKLTDYVTNFDYTEYKSDIESRLTQTADSITASFESTCEAINDLNGATTEKFNEIAKYIKMDSNGITISDGTDSGGVSLRLDNGIIKFFKTNEKEETLFGWWDGVNFHTGNIYIDVTEKAQFGNFAFVPRSDGSLSFLKVSE